MTAGRVNYIPIFYRGENFLFSFSHYEQDEEEFENTKMGFREKKYKMSNADGSYRNINHWESQGLLLKDVQEQENSWRKFSMVDLIWISIIAESRRLGIGITPLKRLKQILFGYYGENGDTHYFEYCCLQVMEKRKVSLVILQDGTGDFCLDDEVAKVDVLCETYSPNSYYVINFNRVMSKLFGKKDYENPEVMSMHLDKKEKSFLLKMKTSENSNEEYNVKVKDGKIDRFETKSKKVNPQNARKELDNFLNGEIDFGDITFKKQNGKIVVVEQIDKT